VLIALLQPHRTEAAKLNFDSDEALAPAFAMHSLFRIRTFRTMRVEASPCDVRLSAVRKDAQPVQTDTDCRPSRISPTAGRRMTNCQPNREQQRTYERYMKKKKQIEHFDEFIDTN